MSPLERILQDDINRLLDRLAGTVPEGAVGRLAVIDPPLAERIAEVEDRLTLTRGSLLDGYRRWRDAIEECADLWALSSMKLAETGGDRGSHAEERAASSSRRAA
jgi:hypothetical protein